VFDPVKPALHYKLRLYKPDEESVRPGAMWGALSAVVLIGWLATLASNCSPDVGVFVFVAGHQCGEDAPVLSSSISLCLRRSHQHI